MAKFNPDFWETTLASASWRQFAVEDRLWHEEPEDREARHRRTEEASKLWPEIRRVIDQVLTDRQREVVLLYFIDELNQRQIAFL